VRLDEEGRRSLTPEALATWLGQQARQAGIRTVVDAFAGAGGNAIGFARAGCEVHAIELHEGRAADAVHHTRLYGVSDRVRIEQGDAVQLVGSQRADLLFCDPPWGDLDRRVCSLADLPLLAELLDAVPDDAYAHLWCKLPPSFDPASLPGFVPTAVFGRASGDRQRVKFVWLRRA
jgi:predicted RNA methylase